MQASNSRALSPEAGPRSLKRARHDPNEPQSAVAPDKSLPAHDEFVRLNVGGEHYDVARSVLDQPRAGTLRHLVARDSTTRVDKDNRICLEADGKLFRYSLYHLRHNRHPEGLPPHKRDMLQVEAEFLGLQQLSHGLLLEKVGKEVESNPGSVSAWLHLADTLYDTGDEKQAWKKLESAYELLPDGDAYDLYEAHYATQLAEKPNCPWRSLRQGSGASLALRVAEFTTGSELSLCLKGKVLLHRGRWQEALTAADAVLSLRSDSVDALLQGGRALVGLHRRSEASFVFNRVLRLRPNEAEAHLGQAFVSLSARQLQQAGNQIQHALSLRPHLPEAHFALGEWYMLNKQGDAALDSFEEALRLGPGLVPAQVGLGRALLVTHQAQLALAEFDAALTHNPHYPSAHYYRGHALHSLGQVSEALEALERALKIAPNYENAQLCKSKWLLSLGRKADALVAALRAVELAPNCASAVGQLAIVQANLEQHHEALRNFERVLEMTPASREAILGRACVLDDLRDPRALPALRAAMQIAPPDVAAPLSIRLGGALTRAGNANEAIGVFSGILQRHPNSIEAHRGRANALCVSRRMADALTDYNRAVLFGPLDAQNHVLRGRHLLLMADFDTARGAFDFALNLTPSASAHFGRAEAYRLLGQFPAALADYQSALRLQPDHTEAQRGRDMVLHHGAG